jgi:putative tricarboxylic transport membrane protein
MVIIALTALSFLYPFWPRIKGLVGLAPRAVAEAAPRAPAPAIARDAAGLLIFGAVALIALVQAAGLNPDAAVFPRTIATGMLCLVGLALAQLVLTGRVTETPVEGSRLRMAAVPLVMLAAVALIPVLGFATVAILLGLALILPAQHDGFGPRAWAWLLGGVVATIAAVTFLFGQVLDVPLP